METTIKNPLNFFQTLLEKDKYEELRESSFSEIIEFRGSSVEKIDSENGIITFWGSFYDQTTDDHIEALVTHNFNDEFNSKINWEFVVARESIDSFILDITTKGSNPKEFINFEVMLLKDLFLKTKLYYLDKPVVKNAIVGLINYVQEKYLTEKIFSLNIKSPNLIEVEDYSEYSFNWDSSNPEDTIPNIEKLYSLLTQAPALIESSKVDFINAFTMRRVTNGIKWLVTHSNQISKSSLFYFIDKLIEEGCITEVPSSQLNKKIDYLFRDSLGQKLKYIRQSKSTSTNNPAQKDRIDSILDSLFS